MFTTGAVYLPFFSLMTFLIAVPTGVKMFNWLGTMWRGQLMLKTPMLFALGFLFMFLIGGVDGAFSASVPVDFALNDTYWVVSHIHYVLFGGSVFGVFAGFYYWFPKMTGRMLDETLGKVQFLTHVRRHEPDVHADARARASRACRDASPTTRPRPAGTTSNLVATIGAFMIALSMLLFLWNIFISLRQRQDRRRRPVGGQHAGVGDLLAAAGVQLRPPAGDPHRAAAVRRAALVVGGRALSERRR